MKILAVAPTPFFADRGTHIRILEEALALEKIGHEITIATYHIGRDIGSEADTKIDVRRIRRLLFWYKKLEAGPDWQKIFLDLMLLRKVFNLARTKRPDIIHAHLHEGVLVGWLVQKLLFWRKMKLVCDFHGSLTKEMVSHSYLSGGILKRIFKRVEMFIDRRGNSAITSSWENTQEIKFIRDEEVETVLDGVNLEYYEKLPSKAEAKRELELPEGRIIITYTGALVPNKGTDYLFGAIPEVLEKNPNAYFIVAGFPSQGIEKLVKEKKLTDSVRIINPLNYFDLPKILNASDLAIDPKDSSTMQASGKILQYMAAGLPVACFDRENNRRYLGEAGEYAKEISGHGLADTILDLSRNHLEIGRKGEISRKRATDFSWVKSAEKIDQIYKKLSHP
ncbi:MAG: Glycosyl transferase group 1 [Candidatus Moranbacteria bacterium GW2011_GWE1_49_15]|nr:MAG: Glycosyl transferase group 1 [Candidatus Moranbacteria bacterium GW2011_GWE1_49_15]HBP00941.1 hypothetical protein [Candidatus Moranbacteria bacterium]